MSWFRDWVKRSPLLAYFVLVFGLEWLLFLLLAWNIPPMIGLLLGSWLPNIVGVFVTGMASGRPALRELFRRVLLWRISFQWYVIVLFLPAILVFLAVGLSTFQGNVQPAFAPAAQWLVIFLSSAFTGAMGEELGWRGTALPRLQGRWNPLISSLILGILWGLYHLPSFLLSGLPLKEAPLIPFMLGALGLTFLVTWTFNRTHGSLILVFLYHLAFNVTINLAGIPTNPAAFWLLGWVCIAAAIAVVVVDRIRFTRPASTAAEGIWKIPAMTPGAAPSQPGS